jgi:hypothetical protein
MLVSIKSVRDPSTNAARSRTTSWVTAPFSGRLSQDKIVNAVAPAARRAISPATSRAGSELTGSRGSALSASRSRWTVSRFTSNPPFGARRYPASVTVMVTMATSGRLR